MSIDELLFTIRERRLILINEREIWPAPGYTADIKRALRRHRKGLRLLIASADTRTCSSPGLHRRYWRYASGADLNVKYAGELQYEHGAQG